MLGSQIYVLVLQRDTITRQLLQRKTFHWGWLTSFRGLVCRHHGKKHGSVQADMVLEKELRVLHLYLQAAEGDCVPHWA